MMVLGDGQQVRELCRQIEEEKDPIKFGELVKRLNDLLDGNLTDGQQGEKNQDHNEVAPSSMPPDPNEISSAIQLIQEEIDRLYDEQSAALKSAAYLGMTPAIAKQFDDRRLHISGLMQKMLELRQNILSNESPQVPGEVVENEKTDVDPKPPETLSS